MRNLRRPRRGRGLGTGGLRLNGFILSLVDLIIYGIVVYDFSF